MVTNLNYTQIPNEFFDYLPTLAGSEVKVFFAICRKTFGWHKDTDSISISQIMEVTALSNRCTIDSVRGLENKGLIVVDRVVGSTSRYTVNVKSSQGSEESSQGSVEKFTGTCEESSHTKETIKQIRHHRSQKALPNFDWDTTEWENIPDSLVAFWQKAYPDVAIDQELIAMGAWLKMNPDKAPKSRYGRFIVSWLYRKQYGWRKE